MYELSDLQRRTPQHDIQAVHRKGISINHFLHNFPTFIVLKKMFYKISLATKFFVPNCSCLYLSFIGSIFRGFLKIFQSFVSFPLLYSVTLIHPDFLIC